VSVAADVPAKVTKPGGLTLPAKALADVVKSLAADAVTIRAQENNFAQVSGGRAEFKIVGLGARDYPQLPALPEVFTPVDAAALGALIDRVAFSVSTDESRYHLSGALLEQRERGLRMVSTDGHRLSLADVATEVRLGRDEAGDILIPRKALLELRRAMDAADQVGLGFTSGHIHARLGDATISARLLEAKFPPYEAVIPKAVHRTVEVERETLAAALKRVGLFSPEKSGGVSMEVREATLTIRTDSPELGEAREEVDIVSVAGAGRIAVGWNARYLGEALAKLDGDRVAFDFGEGPEDPGVLRPLEGNDCLFVVMPMRL
jgi:DNA polymerase-3 subunit beta